MRLWRTFRGKKLIFKLNQKKYFSKPWRTFRKKNYFLLRKFRLYLFLYKLIFFFICKKQTSFERQHFKIYSLFVFLARRWQFSLLVVSLWNGYEYWIRKGIKRNFTDFYFIFLSYIFLFKQSFRLFFCG